jgi:hypothetical protein
MKMSTPSSHRHQSSLEGWIDFTQTQPLASEATRIFNAVIKACEPLQPSKGPYKQITLVRLTYQYARSEASRDNYLRFFFQHTDIPTKISDWEQVRSNNYGPQIIAFAELLVQNFFLPRKISSALLTLDSY